MNIIRIENVKDISSTKYSLTIRVEKFKETNIQHAIVVLSEDDISDINTVLKLRGFNIDILLIPKKFQYTLPKTEYFKILQGQLSKDYTITYF